MRNTVQTETQADFIREHDVDIAILSINRDHAQMIADELIGLGIKAIWKDCKDAVKKLKAKLIIRDGRGDAEIQMAQIHDLIAQETGCVVAVFDDIAANGRVTESGKNTGTPIVLVEGRQSSPNAARDAAYKAVEEAWNKVKAKAVKPSFYNGY